MKQIDSLAMESGLRIAVRLRTSLLLAAIGAGLAGCGQPDAASQVAAMNDSNVRRVANLYTAFQMRKGFHGPKDEEEFKDFITNEMLPKKLEMMGVDPGSLEELFTSESNGERLEIIYDQVGFLGAEIAVVFETPDSNGKRRVGFTNGPIETIDDLQYQRLKEKPLRNGETPQPPGAEQGGNI